LFKKGAEILENFTKSNGNVENILEQLKNIYGALGDSANFQRVKKLLGQ
jgi:tetratricopeptide repeat protein